MKNNSTHNTNIKIYLLLIFLWVKSICLMAETNRRAKRWDRLVKQNDIDREIYLRETKIKNDKFVQDIKEKHNNQILKKKLNELPKRQTTIAACDSMRDFEKLKAETK